MDKRVKARINFQVREIEVECDQAVADQWIEKLIGMLGDRKDLGVAQALGPRSTSQSGPTAKKVPENFGEFLLQFREDVSDTDRVLIAGHHVQSGRDEEAFSTTDIRDLLISHGFRVSNPSDCVRRNIQQRRAFLLSGGMYRVSNDGVAYLETLKVP